MYQSSATAVCSDGDQGAAQHGGTTQADVCGTRPPADAAAAELEPPATNLEPEQKLSKNQLKKLKRKQIWEDHRDDRKRKRKEKRHQRSDQRRELVENARAEGIDPATVLPPRKRPTSSTHVPISLILDCDFEDYMLPEELVSLSGQLVRCYSDNRHSKYQSHLFFSSFGGKLKERFETTLQSQHDKWIGAHFVSEDYREAAKKAQDLMRGPDGGELIDLLGATTSARDESRPGEVTDAEEGSRPTDDTNSVVYLTSDSPNTLTKLEPYTSYVIGGIVDRNREKGLCYKRAQGHGVRTAKLPIGEYMALSTRHVLTTNQVVDIMLKWMECGDWGSAFMGAIPPRKGGSLKTVDAQPGQDVQTTEPAHEMASGC